MPFAEIKQGGWVLPDGVYPVILAAIDGDTEDPNAPRHVVPESGPNMGKDCYYWDWKFKVNVPGGHALDGSDLEASTTSSSGKKSKMFAYLTALMGGIAPAVGETFEKTDLIGRMALATVQKDAAGYCNITNLSAIPPSMQQQAFVAATSAPAQPPVAAPPTPAEAAAVTAPVAAPAAPAAPMQPQQIIPPMPAQTTTPPPGQFAGAVPTAPAVATDDLPF